MGLFEYTTGGHISCLPPRGAGRALPRGYFCHRHAMGGPLRRDRRAGLAPPRRAGAPFGVPDNRALYCRRGAIHGRHYFLQLAVESNVIDVKHMGFCVF